VPEREQDAVLDLATCTVRLHDLVVAIRLAVDGGDRFLEEDGSHPFARDYYHYAIVL